MAWILVALLAIYQPAGTLSMSWQDTEKAVIMREEGLSLEAYKDNLGNWCIGYGHFLKKPIPDISKQGAQRLLDEDFDKAVEIASTEVDNFHELNGPRKGALVHMAFQLGANGFSEFRATLTLMQQKNWHKAAAHIRMSLWAKQTPFRAYRIAERIESGRYREQ